METLSCLWQRLQVYVTLFSRHRFCDDWHDSTV